MLWSLQELRGGQDQLLAQREDHRDLRAELRAEREKYTQLFDGAPDPYLVTDADLRILSANRAGADLFNISQRFLSGKSLSVFLSKGRGRLFVEAARLASAGESADWAFAIRPRERAPLQVKARVVVHATDEGVELHWDPATRLMTRCCIESNLVIVAWPLTPRIGSCVPMAHPLRFPAAWLKPSAMIRSSRAFRRRTRPASWTRIVSPSALTSCIFHAAGRTDSIRTTGSSPSRVDQQQEVRQVSLNDRARMCAGSAVRAGNTSTGGETSIRRLPRTRWFDHYAATSTRSRSTTRSIGCRRSAHSPPGRRALPRGSSLRSRPAGSSRT